MIIIKCLLDKELPTPYARKTVAPGIAIFLYAPDYHTGYAAKTLHMLREAIEKKDVEQAKPRVTAVEKIHRAIAQAVYSPRLWQQHL